MPTVASSARVPASVELIGEINAALDALIDSGQLRSVAPAHDGALAYVGGNKAPVDHKPLFLSDPLPDMTFVLEDRVTERFIRIIRQGAFITSTSYRIRQHSARRYSRERKRWGKLLTNQARMLLNDLRRLGHA